MTLGVSDRSVSQVGGAGAITPGPRHRIALGENNPDLATLLASLLDMQADLHCVGRAGSCAAVLALHRTQPVDAWLLDLALDDGSSLGLLPTLRRERPDCALLVVSGVIDASLTHHALQHGADAVLAKDGNLDALLAALRQQLTRHQDVSPPA